MALVSIATLLLKMRISLVFNMTWMTPVVELLLMLLLQFFLLCICIAVSVLVDVNQWQVLDFSKFTPGVRPAADDGLLIILEEMPGYIVWQDMSDHLGVNFAWPFVCLFHSYHCNKYFCFIFFPPSDMNLGVWILGLV